VTVRRETAMPASDRLSAFIAAGAWGATVGGAALVISFILEWLVVPYEKLGVAGADLTAWYLVASSLRLLSAVLFLWALLALYDGSRSRPAPSVYGVSLWRSSVQLCSSGMLGLRCLCGPLWHG